MHILPSRGRLAGLQRFFDEGKPEQPGVVVLDEDQKDLYRNVRLPHNWCAIYAPIHAGFVAASNLAFREFPNEKWYGLASDDCVGRTPHWDTTLAERVTGSARILWPADGYRDLCTQPFIDGDICRSLGWWMHPGLTHLWCDSVWQDIEMGLKIGQLQKDVLLEHMHFSLGKSTKDQTYRDRKIQGQREIYERIRSQELPSILEKLRWTTQNERHADFAATHWLAS